TVKDYTVLQSLTKCSYELDDDEKLEISAKSLKIAPSAQKISDDYEGYYEVHEEEVFGFIPDGSKKATDVPDFKAVDAVLESTSSIEKLTLPLKEAEVIIPSRAAQENWSEEKEDDKKMRLSDTVLSSLQTRRSSSSDDEFKGSPITFTVHVSDEQHERDKIHFDMSSNTDKTLESRYPSGSSRIGETQEYKLASA